MTSASTSVDRQRLLVDAVTTQRASARELTVEASEDAVVLGDGTLSFVCTTEQHHRLESVLDQYPAFKLTSRLAEDHGDDVTVSAKSDARNVAQFIEHVFRVVYQYDDAYVLSMTVTTQ